MSDVKMYHELKEQAERMVKVFAYHEMNEYQACIFYQYDWEACEEGCCCPKINRLGKDFNAQNECWECKEYKSRS